MKTKEIAELYGVLNAIKLTGMTGLSQLAIVKSSLILKPIATSYSSDSEVTLKMLRPEGFDAIEEKALRHNEALKAGNKKDLLSPEELQKVNEAYDAYFKNVNEALKEISEVEHDVQLKRIPESDFEKLSEANDLSAAALVLIYENLVEDDCKGNK